MKKQVTVLVRFQTKKGMGKRLQEAALSLLDKTRKEKGCIGYYFHANETDPDSFMFYENWTSQQALDEHLDMPYIKEFIKLLDDVLIEKEDFTLWKMFD